MKIVDLFCGCGGFSLGAHLAGFETVLAVDIDATLSSSFKINFPNVELVNGDLSKMTLVNQISFHEVDGVIGGPPCQGFSLMGKRDRNDPRNKFISHFFRHVSELNPAFFIMENVPGILLGQGKTTLKNAMESVKNTYEIVAPFEVNACEFGAATARSRILVFGFDPKKMRPLTRGDIEKLKKPSSTSVKDAISDIPSPKNGDSNTKEFDWVKYKLGKHSYAQKAATLPPDGIGFPEAVKRLKAGMISGVRPTRHSPEVEARYAALSPGQTDSVSRAARLDWDGLCKTLRAGTGSDKGSYQAVRPIHPDEPRVITVREAARLQGFPDWFVFHPTKWHSFRMIGNSISPYLSEAIMSAVANSLGKQSTSDKAA